MSYVKRIKSTPSQSVIEMSLFYTYKDQPTNPLIREKRAARKNLTPENQKAGNLRRAQNDLKMKIASNFQAGDYYVTLTMRPREEMDAEGKIHKTMWTEDEARAEWRKFYNKLSKLYKMCCEKLRYIGVMEIGKSGMVHFHVLIGAACQPSVTDKMAKLWKHGFIKIQRYGGRASDAANIAGYMKKKNETHIMSTKGLLKPVVQEERVRRSEAWRPKIKAPKGYHVVKDDKCTWSGYTADGYPMVMVTFERDGRGDKESGLYDYEYYSCEGISEKIKRR